MNQEKIPLSGIWDSNELWWLRGFKLPTLSWSKPIVKYMGLPTALVDNLQVWKSIYPSIEFEYHRRSKIKQPELEIFEEINQPLPWQKVVKSALQELAALLGHNVAVELEHWVIRHFLYKEIHWSMNAWSYVLDRACQNFDYDEKRVAPPVILTIILPEIKNLVLYKNIEELREIIKRISPPPVGEDKPLGICSDALWIQDIVEDESIIRALKIISSKTSPQERKEIVRWAELQAAKLSTGTSLINPEDLKGDKYLRVEPPLFEFPSILDASLLEDANFTI